MSCLHVLRVSKVCLSVSDYVAVFAHTLRTLRCIMPHAIFFSAGIDTTRLTLRFALLHMATYPEIQAKVQEEIDRVVGKLFQK